MFALVFRFPAGRYHATPWGRNVNEADVAWPPEPWRILRALIATWWRKGDRGRWTEYDLAALIDALAERPPIYRLPEGAVHAHTRHYMPIGEIRKGLEATTLVFDAFAHLPAGSEMVVAWPEVALPEPLLALAADLASGIGYLGRAESLAACEVSTDWDAGAANCSIEGSDRAEGEPARIIAPRTSADYAIERKRILGDFEAQERAKAAAGRGRLASEKSIAQVVARARASAFGDTCADGEPLTLPARLADALALDTGDYQRFGWSRPPASREVIYLRRPLGTMPRPVRRRAAAADDAARYTVARFLLTGRPRPRIEEAVRIGELMRLAALAQFGWTGDEVAGRSRPKASWVITGRDADNRPLRVREHRHAFWLPEDADGDGEIDHVVVYAREGFGSEVRKKLDQVTRLWIERPRKAGESGDSGLPGTRQEWRLALEGFGAPEDFRDASRLLVRSRTWESVTPFMAAGHLKAGGYPAEIRRLVARRGLPEPTEIGFLRPQLSGAADSNSDPHSSHIGVMVRGRLRRAIHFHRFRSRGGERQLDTIGTFVRLGFSESIEGPLALGYACHFGLGLFASCPGDSGASLREGARRQPRALEDPSRV